MQKPIALGLTMEGSAAKMETKAQAGEDDVSMEQILQSIRQIIAEDGDEKTAVNADPTKTNGASAEVPGSDVLELTEMVEEMPTAPAMPAVPSAPAADAPAPATASANDVLSKIDEALTPVAKPMPKEDLLSSEAATAATSALKKLNANEPPLMTTPSPALRSGQTVEDMVMDMLKPMLKSWLDTNLPTIVERIVEREVKKLTRP